MTADQLAEKSGLTNRAPANQNAVSPTLFVFQTWLGMSIIH